MANAGPAIVAATFGPPTVLETWPRVRRTDLVPCLLGAVKSSIAWLVSIAVLPAWRPPL